jgi:glycosyltransferase involved in cell wall biosynthesis
MHEIAVLIPCFNEATTIGKVVADFRAALPDAAIYVYDNNSTDKTAEIAENAGAIVRREYKQGKGNVLRRMFREVDAKCYIMADGDDQCPASNAPTMAAAVLERNIDMVIGDRMAGGYFRENKRRFHNIGNRIVRGTINFLFGTAKIDIMCGYRALSYLFVKSFPVLSQGFEIETEMTIHAIDKNMAVETIPLQFQNRPPGSESKLNTISDGAKVIFTIAHLFKNYRPLLFFGTVALILTLVGIGFFIPIAVEFLQTSLVPRFPTLFMCIFLWLAALQSFFTGLMLDVARQKNRHDFEMLLHRIERAK